MCSILKNSRKSGKASARKGLLRDEGGVVAAEFAMLSPVLILLLMGIFELGMIMLTNSLMEGAMRESSRYGITGRDDLGVSRVDYIRKIVDEQTFGFVDMDNATFDTLVYPDFGSIGEGEPYVDGNGNGKYDVGETFTDENGSGSWDADLGEAGAGSADDVVLYRVQYDWPIVTPLLDNIIGKDGVFTLSSSIAVRNEPWE